MRRKGRRHGQDDKDAAEDIRHHCGGLAAAGVPALRAGDRRGGGAEIALHRPLPSEKAGGCRQA